MPDRRLHRGPHPEDATLFAATATSKLRAAVADLSWLLSRGYADVAATGLVGDRYRLVHRQRVAVRRCACTDDQQAERARRRVPLTACAGVTVAVDGFNLLTTLEAALAGGVVLRARDGCVRDMASMHGSWKRVTETAPAIALLLDVLAAAAPRAITVVLDRPVNNSGRLAALLRAAAVTRDLPCAVVLSAHADREVVAQGDVIATADSAVLDRAPAHVDLGGVALVRLAPAPWIVDLGAAGD
jgi:hypothetical protein